MEVPADPVPYSEPVYTDWSSVHCHANGMPVVYAVYTGMPLVYPVYTGMSLGGPVSICRVHQNTALHGNATGETLTIAAYTETPLEGL